MQIKGIGVCGGMAIAPIHYVEAPCPADINEHSDREPAQLKARLDQLTAQLQQDFLSRAALCANVSRPRTLKCWRCRRSCFVM